MIEKLKRLAEIEPQKASPMRVFLYIAAAYIAALASRLHLAYTALKNPDFVYDGRIIPLWTADAGLIGAYAKRILSGEMLPYTNEYMAGHLVAWMVRISGAHIDTVMFYAPAFLAPLIVIPVILITALYRVPLVGFFAAVFTSIGFNFYYRSHLGYTDTDILNFFFVFMIFYSMIAVSERRGAVYAFAGFFSFLAFALWYHSYKPLEIGILAVYLLYALVFDRKNSTHYFAILLFGISLLPGGFFLKVQRRVESLRSEVSQSVGSPLLDGIDSRCGGGCHCHRR